MHLQDYAQGGYENTSAHVDIYQYADIIMDKMTPTASVYESTRYQTGWGIAPLYNVLTDIIVDGRTQ